MLAYDLSRHIVACFPGGQLCSAFAPGGSLDRDTAEATPPRGSLDPTDYHQSALPFLIFQLVVLGPEMIHLNLQFL